MEKISSLHDDPLIPKATQHLGEYDNYPERFDPRDKSVLGRVEQFGVDLQVAAEVAGKPVEQFTWEEYSRLMGGAIKARYDLVVASVFDPYLFPGQSDPKRQQRWNEMLQMAQRYKAMTDQSVGLTIVKRESDFQESGNLALVLEAGAHLIESMQDIETLKNSGVVVFGLQYNGDTPLGNKDGLTEFGTLATKHLFERGKVIDLAHSGAKTRKDVMDIAEETGKGGSVAYTHGCADEDIVDSWKSKMGDRGLSRQEVERLIKIGGIIGLGVTGPFFGSTQKVADRIQAIAELDGGIDRVAIGADFGGVEPQLLNEIKSVDDMFRLANVLADSFGMSDEQITKILRSNAKDWLRRALN